MCWAAESVRRQERYVAIEALSKLAQGVVTFWIFSKAEEKCWWIRLDEGGGRGGRLGVRVFLFQCASCSQGIRAYCWTRVGDSL